MFNHEPKDARALDSEKLTCTDCLYEFKHGDALYFKPILYQKVMDGSQIEVMPYCKGCVRGAYMMFSGIGAGE